MSPPRQMAVTGLKIRWMLGKESFGGGANFGKNRTKSEINGKISK
jgi:hypothetical protein